MKPSMRILGLVCVLAMAPGLASAAACTSNATGSWGTVGTWNCVPGPNHVPIAADSVSIANGHTVTISAVANAGSLDVAGTLAVNQALTVAGAANVAGTLTVGTTGSLSLTGNLAIAGGASLSASGGMVIGGTTSVSGTFRNSGATAKSFTGDVTINGGGVWNETSAAGMTFAGNFQNSGSFTGATSTAAVHTFTGTGKAITGPVAIPCVAVSGTYTNANTLTIATRLVVTGTLTNTAGATLNIGATAANLAINPNALDATAVGNVVNYNNAGTQTVFGTTYYHLNLSGTSTKTIATATTVQGNMSTSGSATGSLTAGGLSISGNLTIGSGSAVTIGAANISVSGTTSISGTLNHSGVAGNKLFTGDVTINAGGRWRENSSSALTTVSFAGSLQNSGGTFTGYGTTTTNAVKHVFTGTGKTIGGTLTMPSVTIDGSYTNNGALTVSTVLAGAGSLTNGANATLTIGAVPANLTLVTLNVDADKNTVTYSATASQTIRSATYFNLGTSGTGTKTAGGDLTVKGSLSIGNATTLASGSYTHKIFGNMTNAGSGTLNVSTATYIFTGAAPQTLGGGNSTVTLSFYKLTIDKSDSSSVSLASNVSVTNLLKLSAGTIVTNGFSLAVSRNCTLAISLGTGYVVGNLSLLFPGNSTASCQFPIGDRIGYAPATIVAKVTGGSKTLIARVDAGNHPDGSIKVGIDQNKNANHYWTLTAGTLVVSKTNTYDAKFQYCASPSACVVSTKDTEGEIDSGTTPTNFSAAMMPAGTTVWGGQIGQPATGYISLTKLEAFGVFDVGEKIAYHHIGIFMPIGSCTGSASVTVQACQDSETATCKTPYTAGGVEVKLTANNNASWGGGGLTTTVSFTKNTSLTLNDSKSESVDITAEPTTPTPSDSGTHCYDADGGVLDSCTVVFGPCEFDAVESGKAAKTPIFTKIADSTINLDIVSTTPLKLDKVELVNGSDECEKAASLKTIADSTSIGARGRTGISFSAGAARDARIRMTYSLSGTKYACSSDNFSIRPAYFRLAMPKPGKFKAGVEKVTIKATAVTGDNTTEGYTGTPKFNRDNFTKVGAAEITAESGTGVPVFAAADKGVAEGSLIYWDVGKLVVNENAVSDDDFTGVDSGAGKSDCISGSYSYTYDAQKQVGCLIGSPDLASAGTLGTIDRFIPSFFVTRSTPACKSGGFTYSGQNFAVDVKACAGPDTGTLRDMASDKCRDGASPDVTVTKNYSGTVTLSAVTDSGAVSGSNPVDLKDGRGTTSTRLTLTEATAPTLFGIRASDDDASSSKNTELIVVTKGADESTVVGTMLVRSGRLKFDHAFGSELLSLPMAMTAQYYADATKGWITNTDDSCSTLSISTAPTFSSDASTAPAPCRLYGSNVASCTPPATPLTDAAQMGIRVNNPVSSKGASRRIAADSSRPTFSNGTPGPAGTISQTLDKGVARLLMTAPGTPGSLDVTLLVPDYFKYNGNFPSAKATFGIYKGVKSVIHFREQY